MNFPVPDNYSMLKLTLLSIFNELLGPTGQSKPFSFPEDGHHSHVESINIQTLKCFMWPSYGPLTTQPYIPHSDKQLLYFILPHMAHTSSAFLFR